MTTESELKASLEKASSSFLEQIEDLERKTQDLKRSRDELERRIRESENKIRKIEGTPLLEEPKKEEEKVAEAQPKAKAEPAMPKQMEEPVKEDPPEGSLGAKLMGQQQILSKPGEWVKNKLADQLRLQGQPLEQSFKAKAPGLGPDMAGPKGIPGNLLPGSMPPMSMPLPGGGISLPGMPGMVRPKFGGPVPGPLITPKLPGLGVPPMGPEGGLPGGLMGGMPSAPSGGSMMKASGAISKSSGNTAFQAKSMATPGLGGCGPAPGGMGGCCPALGGMGGCGPAPGGCGPAPGGCGPAPGGCGPSPGGCGPPGGMPKAFPGKGGMGGIGDMGLGCGMGKGAMGNGMMPPPPGGPATAPGGINPPPMGGAPASGAGGEEKEETAEELQDMVQMQMQMQMQMMMMGAMMGKMMGEDGEEKGKKKKKKKGAAGEEAAPQGDTDDLPAGPSPNAEHPCYRPADAPVIPGVSDKRFEGQIKMWFEEKGYGFIDQPELKMKFNGMDVFLQNHQKRHFEKGDFVSFSVFKNYRGQPQATELRRKA